MKTYGKPMPTDGKAMKTYEKQQKPVKTYENLLKPIKTDENL
jgi:hypothetical protein